MIKLNKIYLLLILLLGMLALFIGGPYLYLVFYTFIFMFIFSLLYILIIKSFLNVEIVFRRDYYCTGDVSECITKVNFDLFLPIPYIKIYSEAVKYSNKGFAGELTSITKDENRWIRSNIAFDKRGFYNIGKIGIEITDIFKLVTLIKDEDKNINIKVYPRVFKLKSIESGGKDIFLEKYDKNSTNEEPSIIRDVRKYRRGDSLKKVHWKISAKLNELYVKNSETISGEQYVILLDMNKENYNFQDELSEEKVISLAVSILYYLSNRGICVDVYMNNKIGNMKRIEDRQDFDDFMEYIVFQKSDGELLIYEFIHYIIHRIHKSNRIVLVLASLSNSIINNLAVLKNSGYDISVFYCIDNENSKEIKNSLEAMFINCMSISEINSI